ncbi:MAG: ABC-three component system protein [Clostridium sp.]
MAELINSNYNNQDASSKWSGFNYQGKIAIYIVLYLINNPDKADKADKDEWNIYELEIEGLEDFSILKGGKYISIHQVKAYTSALTPSKLSNAFWGLIGKSIENGTVKKSCLHTLKDVVKLVKNKEDNIKYIKNLEPDKVREKKYKATYNDNDTLLKEAFNKLSFYDNHEGYELTVSLDRVNVLIKDQIKQYYTYKSYPEYRLQETHLDVVLNNILGKIDEHIYKRHSGELNQYNHISFEEIIKYITEVPDTVNHNYFLYNLKRNIFDKTLEYCRYCDEIAEEEDCNCESCNIKKYIEQLNKLDNSQFILYIRNINLNKKLGKDKLIMDEIIEVASQLVGYNDLLNRIEENMTYQGIKDNKIINYISNNIYINTSITHLASNGKHKEVEKREISQNILENLDNNMELRLSTEGAYGLISHNVDIESVKELANKIGKSNDVSTDEKMDELLPQYDRNSMFDDIKIISYENIDKVKEV